MALLFVDGYDTYSLGAELSTAGYSGAFHGNTTYVVGRISGKALATGFSNTTLIRTLTSISAAYAGFAMAVSTTNAMTFFAFKDTTNAVNGPFSLALTGTGSLVTLVGGTTVSVSPTSVMPVDGAWRHVIVSVNSNNTTGSYKVLVENVTTLQAVGIDTAVSTAGIFTTQSLLFNGGMVFDDFYLGDTTGSAPYNANLGDCRIETLRPTADVSVAWVKSTTTSSNYLLVANTSTSTASFVQTSVVGARDIYETGNLSGIPVTVYAVVPQFYHQKLDAGTLNMRIYMEVSGVTAVGANVAPLVSAYRWSQEIFTTNPAGSAWSTTDVNALRIGIETV